MQLFRMFARGPWLLSLFLSPLFLIVAVWLAARLDLRGAKGDAVQWAGTGAVFISHLLACLAQKNRNRETGFGLLLLRLFGGLAIMLFLGGLAFFLMIFIAHGGR